MLTCISSKRAPHLLGRSFFCSFVSCMRPTAPLLLSQSSAREPRREAGRDLTRGRALKSLRGLTAAGEPGEDISCVTSRATSPLIPPTHLLSRCPRARGNRWAKPTGPGPTPRCPAPLLHTPSSLISWHHAENFCLLPVRGRWRGTGDSACPPHDEGLSPGWMLNKSFKVWLSVSSAHSTGEAWRLTLWEVVHDQR